MNLGGWIPHSVYCSHVSYNQYKQHDVQFSSMTFSLFQSSQSSLGFECGCMSYSSQFCPFDLVLCSDIPETCAESISLTPQIPICLKQDMLSGLGSQNSTPVIMT